PRGIIRRVTFDANRLPLTDTTAYGTPLARTVTYTRDPSSGWVTAAVVTTTGTPSAWRMEFEYCPDGTLNSRTKQDGAGPRLTKTYQYGPFGQLAQITDARNRSRYLDYDSRANLWRIRTPGELETRLSYDAAGRLEWVADKHDRRTTLAYEQAGMIVVTNPRGETTRRMDDAIGRATIRIDAQGQQNRGNYDALNRPRLRVDALGQVNSLDYDVNGNLILVRDARQNETRYDYDDTNRMLWRKDPLQAQETYTYAQVRALGAPADPQAGQLAERVDRRGQRAAYTYDELGQ